ncbi:MAG: hypothetical protein KDD64_08570 [Bdellovibrionales bacterium]|nr:hypothetical protein [Bdellovibrionales bacterium]
MAFHIIEEIRKKSREEWHELAHERWTDLRIWVQEHGEAALLFGFLFGLAIAYFFKLFVYLFAVLVIVGLTAYQFTENEGQRESHPDKKPEPKLDENHYGGSKNGNASPSDGEHASSEHR